MIINRKAYWTWNHIHPMVRFFGFVLLAMIVGFSYEFYSVGIVSGFLLFIFIAYFFIRFYVYVP